MEKINRTYSVYKHTTPQGLVYIGVTCLPVERRWESGSGYRRNARFWEAIQTYGWDNIQHEVLASGLTREEGLNKEVEFIEFYKSHDPEFGYNMTFGGQYNKKTEETKRKISRIAKDQYAQGREPNRYWTGRKMSEEMCHKMSEVRRGRKLSPEACRHIAESKTGAKNPNYGKRMSEEAKAHLRKINSIGVVQLKDGKVINEFSSIIEAANRTGIVSQNIARASLGQRKTAGGYEWARK